MSVDFTSALVTGGAGFIGSHLVDALTAQGCRVTVLDNLSTGKEANLASSRERVRFIRGDIRDRHLLDEAVAGCEVVFHLAAIVSVVQTIEDPIGSDLEGYRRGAREIHAAVLALIGRLRCAPP